MLIKALTAYLVTAMLSWSPARDHARHESEPELVARYGAYASSMLVPVLDEPAVFDRDPDRAKTALLVAAVAYKEGAAFAPWVDDGRCNKRAWRILQADGRHICDGGAAYSFWQIHTGYSSPSGWRDGIALDGLGWKHSPDGLTGKDLVADRAAAARVALHMMRASLGRTGTLCGYTGERGDCPKAKERLELATRYFREHPFAPPITGS